MTENLHPSVAEAERYAAHVKELALAFKVGIKYTKAIGRGAAGIEVMVVGRQLLFNVNRQFVVINRVRDASTYAVALHELGHCLSPLRHLVLECSETRRRAAAAGQMAISSARDIRLLLEDEASAWAWAHRHALEWTVAMEQVEKYAFDTYLRIADRFLGHEETRRIVHLLGRTS